MSGKLEKVLALRLGTKLVYVGHPGEIMELMPDGRAIVAHQDRPPKIINLDGTEEPFVWNVAKADKFKNMQPTISMPNYYVDPENPR